MRVIYDKSAKKFIEAQDRLAKLRFREKINGLRKEPPEGDIKPLQGYSNGTLRLRIGLYRVVFRFEENGGEKLLHVLDIDSRGGIYK